MIRLEDIDLFTENDDKMKKIGNDISNRVIDYAGRDVNNGGLGIDINAIKKDWTGEDKGGKGKDIPPSVLGKSKITADVAKTVSDQMHNKFNDFKSNNKVDGRSIIARSRNSVKQFPIYITQTIRVNEAHLLSKLFEKVYTSFFQTVISQNPIITPEEANELGFLKKFHTDVMESAKILINEFYQPIDDFDAIMKESIYHECQLSDTCKVEFSVIPSNLERELIMENARLMNEPLTGLPYIYYEDVSYKAKAKNGDNEKSKENMTIDKKSTSVDNEIVRLKEDDLVDMAKVRLPRVELNLLNMSNSSIENTVESEYPLPSRPDENADGDTIKAYNQKVAVCRKKRNIMRHDLHNKRKNAIENLEDEIVSIKNDIKNGRFNNKENGFIYYNKQTGMYLRKKETVRGLTQQSVLNQTQTPELLRQSDIKKINGMDPYMMKATFIIRDTVTRINTEVSYIIGIKSVMHLIYAQDLADELYELVTGNIKSLQKIRYKTGEIKFMDYMFNLKGLKSDASKNINYNKRWISTLKKLANFNKTNGSLLKKPIDFIKGGNAIPNATLVLSQSDVISLVNKTGIDLSQITNAKKLANNLFLIAIAIVDPSSGSMKVFYPDRDSDWDVQSLASIDAEVSKTDNSNLMKELQKAINK